MNKVLALASMTLMLLLAACGQGGPLRSFQVGEELASYDFTGTNQFEQGTYGNATLLIRDGVYRINVIEGDNELWWGQWGEIYDNVVIDVDVEQVSERPENAFGIMCRVRGRVGVPVTTSQLDAPEAAPEADVIESASTAEASETEAVEATDAAASETEAAEAESTEATAEATGEEMPATVLEQSNGDGYLFLIQGGGSYGIFRARGRNLTPLVNWQTSDAINPGRAQNHLRAVCVGDYLAFYINDRLVAEATDNTYQRGQVGLAASAATRLGALIEFDNLTVSEATAG